MRKFPVLDLRSSLLSEIYFEGNACEVRRDLNARGRNFYVYRPADQKRPSYHQSNLRSIINKQRTPCFVSIIKRGMNISGHNPIPVFVRGERDWTTQSRKRSENKKASATEESKGGPCLFWFDAEFCVNISPAAAKSAMLQCAVWYTLAPGQNYVARFTTNWPFWSMWSFIWVLYPLHTFTAGWDVALLI